MAEINPNLSKNGGVSGSGGVTPYAAMAKADTTSDNKVVSGGVAPRIFYRLLASGAVVTATGEHLDIQLTEPLTERQRQAVTDHKPDLLDLADWYAGDAEIIRTLTEDQFVALAEDYTWKRDRYRRRTA